MGRSSSPMTCSDSPKVLHLSQSSTHSLPKRLFQPRGRILRMYVRVLHTVREAREALKSLRKSGACVGLAPTMGALHAGHEALIQAARQGSGAVAVSIFVNPLQFGPNEDYTRYPRPLEKDLEICVRHGVDLVFVPSVEEMYPLQQLTF